MLNVRVLALVTVLLSIGVLPARLSAQRTIPAGVSPPSGEMTPQEIAERSRQRQSASLRSSPAGAWIAVGAFTGGVLGLAYGIRTSAKSDVPVVAMVVLVPMMAGGGTALGALVGGVAYALTDVFRKPADAVVEEK